MEILPLKKLCGKMETKLFSRRVTFIPAEKTGPTFPWPSDGHLRGFRFDWPPWSPSMVTIFNVIIYVSYKTYTVNESF